MQTTKRFMTSDNFPQAGEQLQFLLRFAPKESEQIIAFVNTLIEQSMTNDNFPQARTLLQLLLQFAPKNHATFKKEWSQRRYQKVLIDQEKMARQRGEHDIAEWWGLQRNFDGRDKGTDKYLQRLIVEQAEQAEKSGDWQKAQTLRQEITDIWPSVDKSGKRLENATLMLRYTTIYQRAKLHVEQKQNEQAKQLLKQVWKNAPGVGDPATLAKQTGLYSPLPSGTTFLNIVLLLCAGAIVTPIMLVLSPSLLASLLWSLLISLIVAGIFTGRRFIEHKGQPWQNGAIVVAGCLITVLWELFWLHALHVF